MRWIHLGYVSTEYLEKNADKSDAFTDTYMAQLQPIGRVINVHFEINNYLLMFILRLITVCI
jgi:hypothetical protein